MLKFHCHKSAKYLMFVNRHFGGSAFMEIGIHKAFYSSSNLIPEFILHHKPSVRLIGHIYIPI